MTARFSVRFDLTLVEHGYQIDIYTEDDDDPWTVCRDFGDDWPEALVATAVMKAIQDALEGIDRLEDGDLARLHWTPEDLARWRQEYDTYMDGNGPHPSGSGELVLNPRSYLWPSF